MPRCPTCEERWPSLGAEGWQPVTLPFGGSGPARRAWQQGGAPGGTECQWFGVVSSGIGRFPFRIAQSRETAGHVLRRTRSAGFLFTDPTEFTLILFPKCSESGLALGLPQWSSPKSHFFVSPNGRVGRAKSLCPL